MRRPAHHLRAVTVMSLARSAFVWLALSAGCHDDVESLDHAMSALLASVPRTVDVAAGDTSICAAQSNCFESSHDHRLELVLQPLKPAKRRPRTDSMSFTGHFRLLRIEADRVEVLAEGQLTEGQLSRSFDDYVLLTIGFDGGDFSLDAKDGADWDVARLVLRRLD